MPEFKRALYPKESNEAGYSLRAHKGCRIPHLISDTSDIRITGLTFYTKIAPQFTNQPYHFEPEDIFIMGHNPPGYVNIDSDW